jgi:hypothetical protein
MSSRADTVSWLMRRTTEYRDGERSVAEMVEDLHDIRKLGPGFC